MHASALERTKFQPKIKTNFETPIVERSPVVADRFGHHDGCVHADPEKMGEWWEFLLGCRKCDGR